MANELGVVNTRLDGMLGIELMPVEVDRGRNYEFAQEQCLSALTHIAWVPRRAFPVTIGPINIFQIQ